MTLQDCIADANKSGRGHSQYRIQNTACVLWITVAAKSFLGLDLTIDASYTFEGWEKADTFIDNNE